MGDRRRGVLLVTQHLNPGGVETHVATLARQLLRDGKRVIIAASGGMLANDLGMAGAKVYQMPIVPPDLGQAERSIADLTDIIRAEDIGIVHIHHYLPLLVGALAAAGTERPWVVTTHGVQSPAEWMWYYGPWYYDFCRFALKRAAGIIAVSAEVADQVAAAYQLPRSNIVVIHNAVDLQQFAFRPDHFTDRPPGTPIRLNYISRLDADKRPAILASLSLFEELWNRGQPTDLTIVGDGNIKVEIEQAAAALTGRVAPGHVRLAGAQSSSAPIIGTHDVVLGVGRVLLEAMAIGRLAVLDGIPGLVDLITPTNYTKLNYSNFSGRAFSPSSPAAVAGQLLDILAEPARLQSHLPELRANIEATHDLGSVTGEIVRQYEGATTSETRAVRSAAANWLQVVSAGSPWLEARRRSLLGPPPPSLLAQAQEAQAALLQGNAAGAMPALRAVLAAQPDDAHASEALARLLLDAEQPAAALEVLEPALTAHPHDVRLRLQRGRGMLALGHYADARATLDGALAYQPENPHLVGARLQCDLLERDDIIRDLQSAVEEQTAWAQSSAREIARRGATIEWQQAQLAERDAMIARLNQQIVGPKVRRVVQLLGARLARRRNTAGGSMRRSGDDRDTRPPEHDEV